MRRRDQEWIGVILAILFSSRSVANVYDVLFYWQYIYTIIDILRLYEGDLHLPRRYSPACGYHTTSDKTSYCITNEHHHPFPDKHPHGCADPSCIPSYRYILWFRRVFSEVNEMKMIKAGPAILAGLLVITLLAIASAADIGEAGGNVTPPGGMNVTPPGGTNETPPGGMNVTPSGGTNETPPGGMNVTPPGGTNVTPPGGLNVTDNMTPPGFENLSVQVIASTTGPTPAIIGGDVVVWVDNVTGQTDIFLYDLTTGQVQQISDDPLEKMDPFTDGKRLIWSQNFNGQWDLNLYDFTTGAQVLLTNDEAVERYPSIFGNTVVWSAENETGWNIYKLELSGGPMGNMTPPGGAAPVQPQSPTQPPSGNATPQPPSGNVTPQPPSGNATPTQPQSGGIAPQQPRSPSQPFGPSI